MLLLARQAQEVQVKIISSSGPDVSCQERGGASEQARERVDEIDTQRHTEYEPTPHTKPKNSLRLLVMTLVGELGDR